MNLVDPTVDAELVKSLSRRALAALRAGRPSDLLPSDPTALETVHALCLALASACSAAGVSHVEDVCNEVTAMFRSVESGKAQRTPGAPRVKVVGPEQFHQIAAKYGLRF